MENQAHQPRTPVARVIVVGSANVDLVARTPRLPAPGETVLGTNFSRHRGGKGANQAVAAARDGARVTMIGRLGPDENGVFLREGMRADGIDDRFVGECKHDPSGVALITVDERNGENTIVVVPGANAMLRAVHVEDAVAAGAFDGARVVLAQLEVPQAAVAAAFTAAREAGAVTVLNAAPAASVEPDVLRLCDVLVVNESEIADVGGNADVETALVNVRRSVGSVVLTLGARGVRMLDRSGDRSVVAHAVDPVDTTGAGDAFCGVLASALATGATLDAAVDRANAAGALATTVEGAQPSAPSSSAIDALLDRRTTTRPAADGSGAET